MKLEAINHKQKDNVHIASVLDARRPTLSGLYLVKTRVTVIKTQKYYPTGVKMSIEDWQRMPKAKEISLAEARRSIEASNKVVYDAVKELCELNSFSFDRLEALLGRGNKKSVNNAFEAKIKELEKNDQFSTADYYKNALNSFICFKCGKWCKRKEKQSCKKEGIEITFDEITANYMQRYELESLKNGYSKTSVAMYTTAMRTICNVVLKDKIIRPVDYCFSTKSGKDSYKIKKSGARRIALPLEEIKLIADANIDDKATNRIRSRDLFLFSFWANGINMADITRLKWNEYNPKTNEFTFIRKKTTRTVTEDIYITFPLFPAMKAIIDRWGNEKQADNNVFPFLKGNESEKQATYLTKNLTKVTNSNLKKLVKSINQKLPEHEQLPDDISTYVARHSYATILAHKRVPESYISFAFGHSRKTVTDSYIEEYSKEDRVHYNSMLQFS